MSKASARGPGPVDDPHYHIFEPVHEDGRLTSYQLVHDLFASRATASRYAKEYASNRVKATVKPCPNPAI